MELAYNGMIQKDLAAAIGITTASLSAKFKGKTNWNLVDVEKAAELFHTRPEALVSSNEWGRRGLNPGPAGSGSKPLRGIMQRFTLAA